MRQSWRELRRAHPGERFQQQYRRRHESGTHPLRRALYIGGGIVLVAAGVFFLPAPGPGFLIIALGGGLLAQESKLAARALDWTELRLRALLRRALRTWRRAPLPLKAVYLLLGLGAGFGAAWVTWRAFF